MEKKIMTFALIMMAIISQAQTLEECQQAAKKNYPCIKKYDLIDQTTELTVKNIKKWLPHFTASAQTTYQSEVASWPQSMQSMFQQMGLKMKGLTKEQYKVGIELQQTIYDGGIISNQSQIAQQEGKIQAAQNELDLYQVRKRINEMYFSLLLLDEQIKLNENLNALLLSSEDKLAAWVKVGTASISDFDNVKAERLSKFEIATQNITACIKYFLWHRSKSASEAKYPPLYNIYEQPSRTKNFRQSAKTYRDTRESLKCTIKTQVWSFCPRLLWLSRIESF